jgi:hypothetical protein
VVLVSFFPFTNVVLVSLALRPVCFASTARSFLPWISSARFVISAPRVCFVPRRFVLATLFSCVFPGWTSFWASCFHLPLAGSAPNYFFWSRSAAAYFYSPSQAARELLVISLPSVWLSSVAGQAMIFPQRVSVAARIFLRPRPLQSARRGMSPRQLIVLSLLCVLKFFCDLVPCSSSLFCSKFLLAGVAGLILSYRIKKLEGS